MGSKKNHTPPPSSSLGLDSHFSGQSNKPLSKPAHSLTSQDVLRELASDPGRGLLQEDAARRLLELGPNQLSGSKGVRPLTIFLEQIFNAMTLVLVLALAASFAIQAWIEGGILAGIIVLNIFIGFAQSLHAEKTIDSLRALGSPTCRVFRDGSTVKIQTADVVPGDIVDLATGDSVPADIRLIEAVNLEADEALLTGESIAVVKNPQLVLDQDAGPADRLNVVYSSTNITKGRGRGVVFATGMFTEIGIIAGALNQGSRGSAPNGTKDSDPASSSPLSYLRSWFWAFIAWGGEFLGLTVGTPLQKKLARLFLWLLAMAVVCAIIVLGANRFDARRDVVLYAVTTAIGTIPVSLLLVLTVTMAAGTKKMVERHVIVRNLRSLEALGGVTNICSDKTGTITQGRMVVRKAWIPGLGTYSVTTGNDVYDPAAADVSFSPTQPKDLQETSDEKQVAWTPVTPLDEPLSKPALSRSLNVATLANLATLEPASCPHDDDDADAEADADDDAASDAASRTGAEKPASGWKAQGAPTDIAIQVFAARFGWDRTRLSESTASRWKHVAEFPFDSEIKTMSALFRDTESNELHVFSKGAVERIVDVCDRIVAGSSTVALDDETKTQVLANMDALACQGLRVLALAHKMYDGSVSDDDFGHGQGPSRGQFESGLALCGLVGIYDAPRPESLPSVRACQGAGIVVHMLTGDHPQTARAIAAEVNILPPPDRMKMLPADVAESMVMTAHQFDALSDAQLDDLAQLPLVVARCSPSTKVRMIEALHRRNRYVAMTGDGVNDSPSLKRADIGIAMGSGSDVAKQASDIVLTDDNFASILNAVEEGRRIFDNIQKFILHVLAANLGFVVSLLSGLAFKDASGVSVFLVTPVEILWMLMGTGAFCETGLGFEKAVVGILNRPPQNLRYGVFTPEFLLDILVYGLLMACCAIGSFVIVVFGFGQGNLGLDCNTAYSDSCRQVFRARATCYSTMTWIFLFFAWELIDLRLSFFYMPKGPAAWAAHLWGNPFLFFSVVIVFFIVFPTLYIPVINHVVFMHSGISWEWAIVFIALFVFIIGAESWKWAKRAYCRRRSPRLQPQLAWTEDP